MKRIFSFFFAAALLLLSGCSEKESETAMPLPGSDPFAVEGSGGSGTVEVESERTAFNPLTGLSDMPTDRIGMRPVAVSVNNFSMSWPQYGVSKADYIIETETEGGITRLLCLYSDAREVPAIGSVRSLRDQFIEAVYPLNPILVHIGTSVYADRAIAEHGFRTLDGGNYPAAIWTDRARLEEGYASEHCKFTGGEAIEKGIADAGIETASESSVSAFLFIGESDPKTVPESGQADTVKYHFSSYYDGDFRYDKAAGKYLKWQFGREQVDAEGGAQLAFDNVFLLFANIYPTPGIALVEVDFAVGGEGYYFSQGYYEKITWEKPEYGSNFRFYKEDGSELLVNTGKTHLGIVDDDLESRLVIAPEP